MRNFTIFSVIALILSFGGLVFADIIHVRDPQDDSIQDAIDEAEDGDTVLVYEDIWTENIN
ncbi:MAG: hypothetical protein P9M15_00855, partial [Candidatus Electryoneaceae bacterium]|nr:hypothetical protein [Candidatus Electryoneaceae bacterium]